MDVSPKMLREVEFREKFRGYHPEDVDTFLEKVAVGIEALQNQLRQATERAAHAEQLASDTGTSDEALSRTLLLAQRTADMAVEEAKGEASRVVTAAESQARIIVDEANQRAQRIAEESQAALRADLASLEEARTQLQADVETLQQWIEQHRSSLTSSLSAVLQQLHEGLVVLSEPPGLTAVDVPPEPAAAEADEEEWEEGWDAGDESDAAADGEWEYEEEDEDVLPEDEVPAGDEAVAAAEDAPVEATTEPSEGEDDDAFMAELRRAVTDNEPLGPRDTATVPPPDDTRGPLGDDLDARRFGSRFRRNR